MKALVTGASGFIGGYLIEQLKARGHKVTAFVHPGSRADHLRASNVGVVTGDVTNHESVLEACKGQNWVFHTAAIVGNYGAWKQFEHIGVNGTKNVIHAAAAVGVDRFVHLSSIAVYGTWTHGVPLTEKTPFDENCESWNHYVRQKVSSEKMLWTAHSEGKIQATAIRPSLVLGPRDRNVVRRTLNIIRSPIGGIVGGGHNRMPCVEVEELAAAVVDAASTDAAIGKAYNISGKDPITQLEFMKLHAAAARLNPLKWKVPLPLAMGFCAVMEWAYRLARREREPFFTRIAVVFAGHDFEVDCSLAAADLGWQGIHSYKDAIQRSVEWYQRNLIDGNGRGGHAFP